MNSEHCLNTCMFGRRMPPNSVTPVTNIYHYDIQVYTLWVILDLNLV